MLGMVSPIVVLSHELKSAHLGSNLSLLWDVRVVELWPVHVATRAFSKAF
jgi:hypothetical protein